MGRGMGAEKRTTAHFSMMAATMSLGTFCHAKAKSCALTEPPRPRSQIVHNERISPSFGASDSHPVKSALDHGSFIQKVFGTVVVGPRPQSASHRAIASSAGCRSWRSAKLAEGFASQSHFKCRPHVLGDIFQDLVPLALGPHFGAGFHSWSCP